MSWLPSWSVGMKCWVRSSLDFCGFSCLEMDGWNKSVDKPNAMRSTCRHRGSTAETTGQFRWSDEWIPSCNSGMSTEWESENVCEEPTSIYWTEDKGVGTSGHSWWQMKADKGWRHGACGSSLSMRCTWEGVRVVQKCVCWIQNIVGDCGGNFGENIIQSWYLSSKLTETKMRNLCFKYLCKNNLSKGKGDSSVCKALTVHWVRAPESR